MDWKQFEKEIFDLFAPPRVSKGSMRKYRQAFPYLRASADSPAQVDVAAICRCQRFIAEELVMIRGVKRKRAASTCNSLMRNVLAMVNVLLRREVIRKSPFAMEKFFVRQKKTHAPCRSSEQIQRVLWRASIESVEAADVAASTNGSLYAKRLAERRAWNAKRIEALVTVLAYTAMRAGEALHLRQENIDLVRGVIEIGDDEESDYQTKTERSRAPVPLPDPAISVVRDWLALNLGKRYAFPQWSADAPWKGGDWRYRPLAQVKSLGERAGVSGLTLLSFRHSWATAARSMGYSRETIQQVMRHSNPRTQDWYVLEEVSHLREKVKGFGYSNGKERTL